MDSNNRRTIYTPNYFKCDDEAYKFLEENSFGTIITISDGNPVVSKVPFLIRKEPTGIKMYGHIAYANIQWKGLQESETKNQNVTITFDGPHTYISSSWYLEPDVPTWNYSTCIVKGIPKLIEDPQQKYELLDQLSSKYENITKSTNPEHKIWEISNISRDAIDNLLKKIKFFEVEIAHIECKFKMSQNRSEVDQLRIVENLRLGNNQDKEVAEFMYTIQKSIKQ